MVVMRTGLAVLVVLALGVGPVEAGDVKIVVNDAAPFALQRATIAPGSQGARAHGVQLVDLYAASQREVPLRPELIGSDGYHPSDAGYARWAELLWEGVEARIVSQ